MKQFTKTIKTVYKPLWVKPDFTNYNEFFVKIRSQLHYKADHCEKCGRKFQIGDTIGIACFEGIGNRVLCNGCAKEISV